MNRRRRPSGAGLLPRVHIAPRPTRHRPFFTVSLTWSSSPLICRWHQFFKTKKYPPFPRPPKAPITRCAHSGSCSLSGVKPGLRRTSPVSSHFHRGRLMEPEVRPSMHRSNLWLHKPTTMEVTEIGGVLLSPGFTPDREQDPLWAHRVMGAFGDRANGGFFGALENWFQRQINGEEIQVKLTVKNGRWRVRRGAMCTLGKSPAPQGSLRRFIPWDERGQAIRAASLYLLQDDSAIIAFEQHLFWYSKTARVEERDLSRALEEVQGSALS